MLNIYDSLLDNQRESMPSRTKLFIISTDDDGKIDLYMHGIAFTPERNGTMFIVDEWIIPQIDKVQFKDGTLSVKEGMELEPPVKSEKQLQIEAIERHLAALKAEPDEPADTEEQTNLININEATHSELSTLTGIGGIKASEIIFYRTDKSVQEPYRKPFTVPEDIMKVSGIGQSLYDGLKNEITV